MKSTTSHAMSENKLMPLPLHGQTTMRHSSRSELSNYKDHALAHLGHDLSPRQSTSWPEGKEIPGNRAYPGSLLCIFLSFFSFFVLFFLLKVKFQQTVGQEGSSESIPRTEIFGHIKTTPS